MTKPEIVQLIEEKLQKVECSNSFPYCGLKCYVNV